MWAKRQAWKQDHPLRSWAGRPKKRVTCKKSLTLHAPPGQLFSDSNHQQQAGNPQANPLSSLTQLIVITAGVFPLFCSLLQSLFCLLKDYPQYALVFSLFRNHTNSQVSIP